MPVHDHGRCYEVNRNGMKVTSGIPLVSVQTGGVEALCLVDTESQFDFFGEHIYYKVDEPRDIKVDYTNSQKWIRGYC